MSDLCFSAPQSIRSTEHPTKSYFNAQTRFFRVTVDSTADDFSVFAFSSLLHKKSQHNVAVNGSFSEPEDIFKQLFIWSFTEINEIPTPSPLVEADWLLVDVKDL